MPHNGTTYNKGDVAVFTPFFFITETQIEIAAGVRNKVGKPISFYQEFCYRWFSGCAALILSKKKCGLYTCKYNSYITEWL